MRRQLVAFVTLSLVAALAGAPAPAPAHIDVTVHEGTSMSVAVAPDGRTLAVDLQGSIWTLPATTALFGTSNQNTGTAFVSRQAQFGFRLGC